MSTAVDSRLATAVRVSERSAYEPASVRRRTLPIVPSAPVIKTVFIGRPTFYRSQRRGHFDREWRLDGDRGARAQAAADAQLQPARRRPFLHRPHSHPTEPAIRHCRARRGGIETDAIVANRNHETITAFFQR